MDDRKQQLSAFFDRYAGQFNRALRGETPDIEGAAASFAGCFVGAGPQGITCGQNDDSFRAAIPRGYAYYQGIGITAMDILAKEITLLDDLHAMVKVHWKSSFTRKDQTEGSLEFDNLYFTQTRAGAHKIFAYITGDEPGALKNAGLIPSYE